MREERGQLMGNQVFSSGVDLWGNVVGNASIDKGGKVYLRGNIYGDLTVYKGGRAHIYGNVTGRLVVKEGAKVIHSGVVGRDIINEGGRIFIDATGKVLGKVRTKAGETTIDSKADVQEG